MPISALSQEAKKREVLGLNNKKPYQSKLIDPKVAAPMNPLRAAARNR